MTLNILEKHKTWINEYLLQHLFDQQKLIMCKNPNQHIKIKSIDIKPMSLDNTFMLTFCYFVKISIEIQAKQEHMQCADCDNFSGEKDFDLVIKVLNLYLITLNLIASKIFRLDFENSLDRKSMPITMYFIIWKQNFKLKLPFTSISCRK